ncbi:LysM peptidoglycan-binding domain-containing protein [Glaciibacter superstes]|uniref:LysM peptidoglycan-binding domain-containing protein n=1 Tax=Glaciibacter superstes TaxID=501023 RepID=UPI00146C2032|nr:LysM domain-containing protein [Glaciibacter superstes]
MPHNEPPKTSRGMIIALHVILRPHRSLRRGLVLAAASVLVFGLAGCAGAPTPVVTETVTVAPTPTKTPTPTPTPTPPPPAPPVEEPPLVPNPPVGEVVPNAPAPVVEPGPAVDLGAGPGAEGAATADGDGNLLTYTVVSGDTFFDIAQRFDVPVQQFLHMNPSVPGLGEDIYINQVINLDWNTKL